MRRISTRPLILAQAITLAFALPTFAHADDTELATINVQGQNTTRGSVITGETLKNQSAQNIKDITLYEAGVDVSANNTQGGNSSFTIRGMAENRIAINVDGIALPETNRDLVGGGSTTETSGRDLIETDTLKSVNILKGSDASHAGNGALAASVNMTTYSPEDFLQDKDSYAEARYQYRSDYQSHGYGATLAGRHEQITGLLMFTRRNFHEADTVGGTAGTGTSRTTANDQDSQQYNILAKANFGTGEHRVETTLEQFHRETDTHRADQETGATTSYTAHDEYRRRRFSVRYLYRPQNHAWLTQASVHAYHQNTETHDNYISTNTNPARNVNQRNETETHQTGLQVAFNGQTQTGTIGHQFNVDFGLSRTLNNRLRQNASTTNSYFPPSTRHNITLGAQDKMQLNAQTALELGLRYEYETTRFKPDAAYLAAAARAGFTAPNFQNGHVHALLPSIRISHNLTPELTAFAAYSQAWRSPNALNQAAGYSNRIPGVIAYRILPNANLNPEKAHHFEAGLSQQSTNWQGKLNIYYSQYRDLITETTTNTHTGSLGGTPYQEFQFTNIPRARTYGIEASAAYRLNENWQLSGSLAWMRGDNQSSGQPLREVHPFTGNLGIAYNQDQWGFNTHLRFAAAQNRVPSDGVKTAGYGVWDASVYYKPSRHIQLNFSVYNIGDKRYWNYADLARQTNPASVTPPASPATAAAAIERQAQPGRNFALGLTAKF